MLAALSPEGQVAAILDDIGCPPSNFSDIAGRHSNSRVIAALQGRNDFDPVDGQYYLALAREMKQLATDYPVPISWKETTRIKEILSSRNQGPPVPFAVIFIGPLLFKRISSGQVETTGSYQECAAFKDGLVAIDAVRILSGMGQLAVRFTRINTERRSPETFVNTLSEVGFQQ